MPFNISTCLFVTCFFHLTFFFLAHKAIACRDMPREYFHGSPDIKDIGSSTCCNPCSIYIRPTGNFFTTLWLTESSHPCLWIHEPLYMFRFARLSSNKSNKGFFFVPFSGAIGVIRASRSPAIWSSMCALTPGRNPTGVTSVDEPLCRLECWSPTSTRTQVSWELSKPRNELVFTKPIKVIRTFNNIFI